jgi:hypothetical protein
MTHLAVQRLQEATAGTAAAETATARAGEAFTDPTSITTRVETIHRAFAEAYPSDHEYGPHNFIEEVYEDTVLARVAEDTCRIPYTFSEGDGKPAVEFGDPEKVKVTLNIEPIGEAHVSRETPDGRVSTLAGGNIIDPCSANIAGRSQEGNRDGKALTALFFGAQGMAYDSKGNLYITDTGNHSIRRLSTDGVVSTFAK